MERLVWQGWPSGGGCGMDCADSMDDIGWKWGPAATNAPELLKAIKPAHTAVGL